MTKEEQEQYEYDRRCWAQWRKEAAVDMLGKVHRMLDHRLENIRGYTDRETPAREIILEILDEIREGFEDIHKEVLS